MPRRRYRAAVLVAVKNKPLRARDPRAFLTATRHVGVYSVRPGRKDGSAGPNKRITRRAKRPLPVLVTNSPQRGGEKSIYFSPFNGEWAVIDHRIPTSRNPDVACLRQRDVVDGAMRGKHDGHHFRSRAIRAPQAHAEQRGYGNATAQPEKPGHAPSIGHLHLNLLRSGTRRRSDPSPHWLIEKLEKRPMGACSGGLTFE